MCFTRAFQRIYIHMSSKPVCTLVVGDNKTYINDIAFFANPNCPDDLWRAVT